MSRGVDGFRFFAQVYRNYLAGHRAMRPRHAWRVLLVLLLHESMAAIWNEPLAVRILLVCHRVLVVS